LLAAQQERVAQRRRVVVEETEVLAAARAELDQKLDVHSDCRLGKYGQKQTSDDKYQA